MPRVVFQRLAQLYLKMDISYRKAAQDIGFTCIDCPDNCCSSYFKHHTRVEWAYFIKGLSQCPDPLKQEIIKKAHDYNAKARMELSKGRTPDIMCPVNDNGLCLLYEHRLMICRLHGVPTIHIRPDGRTLDFPGCFRAQEQAQVSRDCSKLDRTEFYRELAALEQAFVGPKVARISRVDLTLAEMIVEGPPGLSV